MSRTRQMRLVFAAVLASCTPAVASEPPPDPVVSSPPTPDPESQRAQVEPGPESLALDRELEAYTEIARPGLKEAQEIWVRNGQGCTRVALEAHADKTTGSIEVCVRDHGASRVRCHQEVTLDDDVMSYGGLYCEQEDPDGSGKGSGSRPFDRPRWVARAVHDDVVELGPGYRLWVEPARVIRRSAPCQEGTEQAARREIEADGVIDVERGLFDRFGVVAGEQRCDHGEGLQLMAQDLSYRGHGDRAVLGESSDVPVDCSLPCPEDQHRGEVQRRNALLEGRRFFRNEQEPAGYAYLTKAACESADDPALVSGPCDLID